nr:QWRF motif-containing protein 2-like [Ipomoea trifida]
MSRVLINPSSRSRFAERSSTELVNLPLDSLCVQSLIVNPQFIAFSWSFQSRSVEITSTALVNQPIACVGENNQSSFWILCVLTATACCVSIGFADKSKRREAPNVTSTERSPAIPIIVQSSPVKDRIANTKPSGQQRSPGILKLSSTKLSSICFIRSLECGKYPGMFASRAPVPSGANVGGPRTVKRTERKTLENPETTDQEIETEAALPEANDEEAESPQSILGRDITTRINKNHPTDDIIEDPSAEIRT